MLFLHSLIGVFLPTSVYAQNTTNNNFDDAVCTSTPPAMAEYLKFSEKMINALIIVPNTPSVNVPFGPWQAGQYSIEERLRQARRTLQPNILEQAADGAVKDIKSKVNGLVTTALITATQVGGTVVDGFTGILGIFYQPRAIIRDLKRLFDIDTLLGNKMDELWLAGVYFTTLPASVHKELVTIIEQHTGGTHLMQKAELSPWATYANVVEFLLRLNMKHKGFLRDNNKKKFGEEGKPRGMTTKKIDVTFSPSYGSTLQEEYKAARRGACNTSWKVFKQSITNISQSFKNGAGDEIQKFKTAVDKLGAISFKYDVNNKDKKNKAYLERETELMKNLYGLDVKKQQEGIFADIDGEENLGLEGGTNTLDLSAGVGLWPLWRSAFSKKKKDKQTIEAEREAKKQLQAEQKAERDAQKNQKKLVRQEAKQQRKDKKEQERLARQNDPTTLYLPVSQGDLIQDMGNINQAILTLHEQSLELMMATQPTDITLQINRVLQEIRLASNTIHGEQTEDDLIHFLGKACEAQCANLWGECRDNS